MKPENSITFENAFENEHEIEIGLLTVERYIRKNHYPADGLRGVHGLPESC